MSYTSLVHSFLSPWLSLIYTWTFPFLGPGLYIIHPRANHISPWYIICLVQGYVIYIPGLFPCMFLVHPFLSPWLSLIYTWTFSFLGPGLYIIHPRANHLSPWYIICLVQGYVTYIPGAFPCMFLVHPFLSAGLSFIYLDHLHVCFWYIIVLVQDCLEYIPRIPYHPGTSFVLSRAVSHIYLDHLHACSWYIIVLVQGCLEYIPRPTHITLVHHLFGPRLSLIFLNHLHACAWCIITLVQDHFRANYISPWYIIYFVQGYVIYIPGLLSCIPLVHHCIGLGY
jgi:hypothetical protein